MTGVIRCRPAIYASDSRNQFHASHLRDRCCYLCKLRKSNRRSYSGCSGIRMVTRKTSPNSPGSSNVDPNRRAVGNRNTQRAFVRLPAKITVTSEPGEHVAFVRDISPKGMFFYSDFTVPAGEPLTLTMEYSNGSKQVRVQLSGKVVRVEQGASAEAVGIAFVFDSVHNEIPLTPMPRKKLY